MKSNNFSFLKESSQARTLEKTTKQFLISQQIVSDQEFLGIRSSMFEKKKKKKDFFNPAKETCKRKESLQMTVKEAIRASFRLR